MRILLFSDIAMPDSCALATRVISFAKILKALGHDVELLGVSYAQGKPLVGSYDGIAYEMIQAGHWTGIQAYRRIRQIGKDLHRYLEEKSAEAPYDAVLLSNVYYDYSKLFLKYSKKYNAPLLVNAVEWYDKTHQTFLGIFGKIKLLKNRVALKKIHVKMGNIIAISSLLEEYYTECGCNTVRIPTIVDLKEYSTVASAPQKSEGKLHIAYAGVPGRKDYVLHAVEALELLSEEERSRIQLDFYGPTEAQLFGNAVVSDLVRGCVVCHGRIPYAEVKEKIAAADFTVLLRPDKRYANAGFPTKVGESMACGTPVIANLTSDLGKYVIDGETGIVCADETKESCAEAFRKALRLTAEERTDMKIKVLNMATNAFSYDAYIEDMKNFIDRAK